MTTQAKHTPGPWGILYPERTPQLVFAHGNSYRLVVANCGMCDEMISPKAAIANARLIAAAPEMAEVLKAVSGELFGKERYLPIIQHIDEILEKANILDK